MDGFAETDHGIKIYEFLGERWHSGCPHCNPGGHEDRVWIEKKYDILYQNNYKLEYQWGCQFQKILSDVQNIPTSDMPFILRINQREHDIIEGIKSGELFGFITCDITCPDHVAQRWYDFPPVIKRLKVTDEYLTEYMKERIRLEKPGLKEFERDTVIQCFNAKDHLLLTTLAKYYLEEGFLISNIRQFIQYRPSKGILPFVK